VAQPTGEGSRGARRGLWALFQDHESNFCASGLGRDMPRPCRVRRGAGVPRPSGGERCYGFWRGLLDGAVARYLDCGIFERGFDRIRCPDCLTEFLLAFSCKGRGLCPACRACAPAWSRSSRRSVTSPAASPAAAGPPPARGRPCRTSSGCRPGLPVACVRVRASASGGLQRVGPTARRRGRRRRAGRPGSAASAAP